MKKSRKKGFFYEKNNKFALKRLDKLVVKLINLNHITMKKTFKLTALLLAATIMFSSCIGSFQLTKKMYDINNNIGDKWVNELVFAACCILPVYEITLFVDAVVFNTIEFWSGKKVLANVGEKKVVKNSEGKNVEITAMENGYNLTDGVSSMNLVFDEETQIWSAEYNNQTTQLMKFVDENNAQLFLLNGDVMDVTLDAQGVEMARMYMDNSFALYR